jgi:environmental stress-induced protein Ves
LTCDSTPLCFDGASAVACRLVAGATRDFNLMAPPGAATLRRPRGRTEVQVDGPRLLALYAHTVPAVLEADGATTQVPAFHLAWRFTDGPTRVAIDTDNALWMEVAP